MNISRNATAQRNDFYQTDRFTRTSVTTDIRCVTPQKSEDLHPPPHTHTHTGEEKGKAEYSTVVIYP